MSTHVSEKDIRDKILNSHPILNNVRWTQKLEEIHTEIHKGALFREEKINNIKSRKNIERNPVECGINVGSTDKTLKHHGSRARGFLRE